MKLVDLSHPLGTGMPVYPGDPEVEFAHALTIQSDGVAVERLDLGSHSGTHLDAPSHSIDGGRTVDEIPLELLWGPARVLRVGPGVLARAEIGVQSVDVPRSLPGIVCISTGWDAHFGTALATQHPFLSRELVELLWERGARVLGVDTLSPDPTSAPDSSESPSQGMPVHEFWLGNDGVIVENLTGLGLIPDEIELSLLPLRLAAVDGSPIRAVARYSPELVHPHLATDTQN